jgi:hypothetical protein
METSVIHYEFAALAVEKALQAIELTLRLKVDPSSKAGMTGLIKTLEKREALRPELSEYLRDMVRLRNEWVGHPRNAAAFPLVVVFALLGRAYEAVAEISDMEPNREIRQPLVS